MQHEARETVGNGFHSGNGQAIGLEHSGKRFGSWETVVGNRSGNGLQMIFQDIPAYITPAVVGRACKMSRYRAQSLLRRAGILERFGRNYAVGESRLRERLPEIHDRVYAYYELAAEHAKLRALRR